LKELHTVNTAIAEKQKELDWLERRRAVLNQQITDELVACTEMELIKNSLKKTREALTL
jgi:vacuolar-type H+-ATPase subunit I/STV1